MEPMQRHFEPYSQNGGTVVGIAGEDFAVIASDTRLSEGYSIHTRECPKLFKLTPHAVLGACGFHGDVLTMTKVVEHRLVQFEHDHEKKMSAQSIAQMLSTILYSRRFFPYYVYNILAGIDDHGKGCVYSYDPVGSYEREEFRAGGSAAALLQPLLDNQIGLKNQQNVQKVSLTKEKTVALIKDIFTAAGERDIYTGDRVEIMIITKDGVERDSWQLRRD